MSLERLYYIRVWRWIRLMGIKKLEHERDMKVNEIVVDCQDV